MSGATGNEGGAAARGLRALGEDPRLRELGTYVPPLSLVRAFGVERNEVAHSRVLARLLDPGRHRQAGAALRSLLRATAEGADLDEETADVLRAVAEAPWTRVAVHRERMHIDVIVEISSARGTVVLGIENKIDAGERPEQLARYQAALARAYPGWTAVLAFLTPTGRDPTTALEGTAVPVVALDYGAFLSAAGEARRRAASGSRDERALLEFEDHLREAILREPGEDDARALARGLWREHGRALRFVAENRPRLSDIRDEYVSLLVSRYPDARFDYYPGRGANVREIKMNLRSWDERGFPFTFMLETNGEDGKPRVRALIWRESYQERSDALAAWAFRTNDMEGLAIEGSFPASAAGAGTRSSRKTTTRRTRCWSRTPSTGRPLGRPSTPWWSSSNSCDRTSRELERIVYGVRARQAPDRTSQPERFDPSVRLHTRTS
jgi:hypothetical protein